MISLHRRSLLASVFLCLLTTSGAAALGDVPHDRHRQDQAQDEPRQSPPQPDQQRVVRPPVVYIMESGWPGIVPGFVIGPSSPAGLRPDIYEAFRTAASLKRIAVDVTIYPDQADYVLALDVTSYPWSSWQTWTLVNARSGVILRQERGLLLQNALRDALGVIGRLWSAQQQSVQRP